MTHDVAVVFGTRPEIIKLAPIIAGLGKRALVIHTGQHFDDAMSQTFLRQMGIGQADYDLKVGGLTRGAQIGNATTAIEQLLIELGPKVVVVQGDTNSALAGALGANAAGIALVHLEAGLRSFDRSMPEEHNRVLIDALSDRCLVPHESNARLLRQEGVADERIRVTGSTLREALVGILPPEAERRAFVRDLDVEPTEFILATIHRPENADNDTVLRTIFSELADLDLPVVLPLHPRTRARAKEFGLGPLLEKLRVLGPLGYREFLCLAAECALLISDSGGVQEEATIVKRPAVIVRRSTERPELLGTFAYLVPPGPKIGETARHLLADVAATHAALAALDYPYGTRATALSLAAIDQMITSRS